MHRRYDTRLDHTRTTVAAAAYRSPFETNLASQPLLYLLDQMIPEISDAQLHQQVQ